MTGFWRCAVLGAFGLAACGGGGGGGGGLDIRTLIPADNEVGTSTRDGDMRVLPDEQATKGENEGGLDGSADPFHDAGLVQVALQDFVNGDDHQISLKIWQMTDVAAAEAVYDDLVSPQDASSWASENIGDEGRIAKTLLTWIVNARKGAYYVDASIKPNTGSTDTELKAFVEAVVSKIP